MKSLWLKLSMLVLASAMLLQPARPSALALAKTAEQEKIAAAIERQLGPTRSFALVIGISHFDNMRQLPGVESEVRQVAATLQMHGFFVPPQPQSGRMTHEELRRQVVEFIRTYGRSPENRLVIYIATHGFAAGKDDPKGYGYLMASDTKPLPRDIADTAYSVNDLSAALREVASKHVYLFFNACFSGAMIPLITRGDTASEIVKKKPVQALTDEGRSWVSELLAHDARLILTAGSDEQTVPDINNPFSEAFITGLNGEADRDGDGLILGFELAVFIKEQVAKKTLRNGVPNDTMFAVVPKEEGKTVNFALLGDYVFLSPRGPHEAGQAITISEEEMITARRNAELEKLLPGTFAECADCPVMVEIPAVKGRRVAFAKTELTYAQWDACYREAACGRYIEDTSGRRGNMPVGGITWQDAAEYIQWLNKERGSTGCTGEYRLPSSSEWSAAEKGPRTTQGSEILVSRVVCWGCGDGLDGSGPSPAGSLPANASGLHDMTGSLWEWATAATDQCEIKDSLNEKKCQKPATVMGGSFATRVSSLRMGAIGEMPRTLSPRNVGSAAGAYSLPTVGLRVVCNIKPQASN
ncbi:SUMF1/EgtB/PvdO family nonheme iron enzyme [Mesorhizobium sp. M0500]|uniref:SUMF1/EgtB/PvdO family nonheme iron enzyme n=1 Tax=Mesorhizobium sp. M0500 TaxID=2956953 RepID=UPI003336FE57